MQTANFSLQYYSSFLNSFYWKIPIFSVVFPFYLKIRVATFGAGFNPYPLYEAIEPCNKRQTAALTPLSGKGGIISDTAP
ncbi:MAG TPA: hypothetical protein PK133_00560 [Ferruginibacter sp.]|nr:hypothetical protein [Ferruginibacter sp.]HQY10662.1 hypothetical protein [Ferruginibacter sp.]